MIFQCIILGTLATIASSQFGGEGEHEHHEYGGHHDIQEHHEEHHEEEHYDEPHYKYEYEVKDEHHGDYKKHRESRKGDDVEGYYSLLEPDGTIREVHYTSGKHVGFNAVVTHHGKPIEHHEEPEHKHYEEPKHEHHEIQHHHIPEHHHHQIEHHHVPEYHHHEVEHHHVPEYHHHEIEHHHQEEHHQPELHHREVKHHLPEHHEIEHHHEGGFGGDFGGSSNSPVASKLKPNKPIYGKSQRSVNYKRPYSVHENNRERRRWASIRA